MKFVVTFIERDNEPLEIEAEGFIANVGTGFTDFRQKDGTVLHALQSRMVLYITKSD